MRRYWQSIRIVFSKIKYILLAVVLTISFAAVYKFTDIFEIKTITIASSSEQPLQYVDTLKLSLGLESIKGRKYLNVKTNEILDIVKTDSFVQNIIVSKIFPNTITIYIQERNPFISINIENRQCVLFDQKGYVLIIDKECDEINAKYKPITVTTDDPKIDFVINTQSTYYQIDNFQKIITVLSEYSIGIKNIDVKDDICTITTSKNKRILFSFNQAIPNQLTRFVAVLPQIEISRIKYTSLDLRYNRPVVKK